MHWMYINKSQQEVPDAIQRVEANFAEYTQMTSLGEVSLAYDARLWPTPPIVKTSTDTLLLCGWFIYKRQVNPLQLLLKDILTLGLAQTLQRIEAGIFVGLYEGKKGAVMFNDWFGLSAHFFRVDAGNLLLAPFARTVSSQGQLDATHASYLEQAPHLWGERTIFSEVKRLLPGSLLRLEKVEDSWDVAKEQYSDFAQVEAMPVEQLPEYIQAVAACFPKENKFVSLSAGFDSRLLALTTQPSWAYTWGPKRSKDVVNSKVIATSLNIPWTTFGFEDHAVESKDELLDTYLTEGQIKRHNPQFIRNYRYVAKQLKQRGGSQFVVADGYLGDGLQRGTYCYGSSLRAEVKKVLPAFFVKDSAQHILADSYRSLSPEALEALLGDLKAYDFKGLKITNDCQQATAFETMNVRNFAYVYSGGIAANSVWNVVIAPFAFPRVYKSLVEQPAQDVLTYKVFKKLWSKIDSPAKKLRSEGMYSPVTLRVLIPFYNLIGRILTNYVPGFLNYGTSRKKKG